ncbi:MAG: ribulose-phosphate 3-epimerase, partial [bacterium]|nr:ribulose-phosphate 3-epimerase [bacterium]
LVGEIMLAVDGKTPLEKLQVQNLEDLDGLLIMTINAGFSGQSFMPELLEKVKTIRSKNLFTSLGEEFPIEVDGGINDQTIKLAKEAGANRFVATSFIFKEDPKKQYQLLHHIVNE